jgi:hypothetical protein
MTGEAGEAVQPGADEAAIATLRARLQTEFGATLPDAYADLLRREDGLDVDGLVLYGSWQSPEAGDRAGSGRGWWPPTSCGATCRAARTTWCSGTAICTC